MNPSVRHSLRRGGRRLDPRKADGSNAGGGTELNALDLDVLTLPGPFEDVVERATSIAERIGPTVLLVGLSTVLALLPPCPPPRDGP